MKAVGQPFDRVDGRLKVTGGARYAAEFEPQGMAYAFPVRATIAKGSVISIDSKQAEKAKGVLRILTHANAPRLKTTEGKGLKEAGGGVPERLVALQNAQVHYFGQYVALVVAETYEQARFAASLIKVEYKIGDPAINLGKALETAKRPEKQASGEPAQIGVGAAEAALKEASVMVEQTYTTSHENHHPMEPHATVAHWESTDKLVLHDSTQGVMRDRATIAYLFGLAPENVRVLCPYLGGGFGSKGAPWSHVALTAMAAQVVERPVKLAVTRQMMASSVGKRSATVQTISLGASKDGRLSVLRHHSDSYNNLTEFFEPSGRPSLVLYSAPLREITYLVAKLDLGSPTYTRAPGEASGSFAVECAMDELAHKLGMDPVALRMINHTAVDPVEKLPFSSEALRQCYTVGAERFGWSDRPEKPRSRRDGPYLVGYGMATSTYPASRSASTVRMVMAADASVKVLTASQDIGTGTYTILAQTAADALGISASEITVLLGDSNLPPSPLSAGSQTTASVNPAVLGAGQKLREALLALAQLDSTSPLYGADAESVNFGEGRLFLTGDVKRGESYSHILARAGETSLEACATAMPESGSGLGAKKAPCEVAPFGAEENHDKAKYSFHSFGAQFVEVRVDEALGKLSVARVTSVQHVGRVMNSKTARSQILGGVIYALGQALMEETVFDERYGNPIQRSFADYHVPVQMDVPPIDVVFIDEADPHISPVGARGAGEIGGVGIAAAVANAVFNATGRRLRELPLRPEKLL